MSFFSEFDLKEKEAVQNTIDILTEMLGEWSRQYPFVRTARIPALALHNATVVSRLNILDSALLAKLTLWIFAMDDMIDDRMVSSKDLEQKFIRQWRLAANGNSRDGSNDDDELAVMLGEIRKELSSHRLFGPLCGEWATDLRLLTKAGIQQYHYALRYSAYGPIVLPTLDEYLQNGIYSIGVLWWALTLAIVLDDSSVVECWETMREIAKLTSASVRLYNDVQSLDKEMQENNVNSVIIIYHTLLNRHPSIVKENALSQAKHHIWQMADSYAQKCCDLTKHPRTKSGQFEETMQRMVAYHTFFYHSYDYNNTPMTRVHEILGI